MFYNTIEKLILFFLCCLFQLFDHIADCIHKFMKENRLLDKELPLGFTFSFPCRQEGLARAILTTWTKGFKCEGVEGNNIVDLLHDAVKRRGVSIVKSFNFFSLFIYF